MFIWIGISYGAVSNDAITSVQYKGLHRFSVEALTPWIELQVGDTASKTAISQQIKRLYTSQYFESISSSFNDGKLVFSFKERPIISAISFDGNSVIADKQLEKPVQALGLRPGRAFDPAQLQKLVSGIVHEYKNKGYLKIEVNPEVRRHAEKVVIVINIDENKQAEYDNITFDGNKDFSASTLKWAIKLEKFNLISWFTGGYIYSEENYNRSIRTLYEFYYDHGYLDFEIIDKKVVYDDKENKANVTIKLFEGEPYTLTSINVESSVQLPKAILLMQESLEQQTYSRADVMKLMNGIQEFLKDIGYAYATIEPKQKLDHKKHTIVLNLKVLPEKVYHVRKINFHGNDLSNSTMLRHYLNQNEGQRFSQKELDASKNRLMGLGYFDDVSYKVNPVPGFSDQVDIDYKLSEKDSVNSIMGEIGWGKSSGVNLGADLKFKNFLGSGNQVIMGLKSTKSALIASLTHTDPFFTDYAISRMTKLYYSSVDTDKLESTDYKSKNYGTTVSFGFPVSRYAKIDAGFNIEHSEFKDSDEYSDQVQDFITKHGNSYTNLALKLALGYARYEDDYRNHFNVSAEVGVPSFPHDLTYYTLNLTERFKTTLYKLSPEDKFVFEVISKVSYGQGYGSFSGELPFFKMFHAGGFGTVRNYKSYSLGPKDSKGDILGGDLLTTLGTNLYFPMPFIEKNPFETALFFDMGNVYKNNFSADDLRGSVGLMFLLKFGQIPIGFTLAQSVNEKAGDEFNTFDFAIGVDF